MCALEFFIFEDEQYAKMRHPPAAPDQCCSPACRRRTSACPALTCCCPPDAAPAAPLARLRAGVSPGIVKQVIPVVEQLTPIYLDIANGAQASTTGRWWWCVWWWCVWGGWVGGGGARALEALC